MKPEKHYMNSAKKMDAARGVQSGWGKDTKT